MWVGGQRHAPAGLSPGRDLLPIVQEAGVSRGRSGPVRKISPPPGFDPRTVRPVAICYTDWDLPAHVESKGRQDEYFKWKKNRSSPLNKF